MMGHFAVQDAFADWSTHLRRNFKFVKNNRHDQDSRMAQRAMFGKSRLSSDGDLLSSILADY